MINMFFHIYIYIILHGYIILPAGSQTNSTLALFLVDGPPTQRWPTVESQLVVNVECHYRLLENS